MDSIDDRVINGYGAVGGMRIGRGNQRYLRKPAPVPDFPQALWLHGALGSVRGDFM
jgi:hypothetical protein